MKIPDYELHQRDPGTIDMLVDIRNAINNGRVIPPISTTVPTGTGEEGQKQLYYNGDFVGEYTYVNGVWRESILGMEIGWGYITVSGTPAYQIATLTFERTYAKAPFVMVTYLGVKAGSDPTTPGDLTGANTLRIVAAYAPTTTSVSVVVYTGNSSALTNNDREAFGYIVVPVS